MENSIAQRKVEIPRRAGCRSCAAPIITFLDFGYMPLAGAFLEPATTTENVYRMEVCFCPECSLVQIPNVVSKDILFHNEYRYLSSTIPSLVAHFVEYAGYLDELTASLPQRMVVEFGCNDGVLLSALTARGVPCAGVDASENVVKIGREQGLNVSCGFFGPALTSELIQQGLSPSVITGSNVFAHNDDIEEILRGVQILLRDDGYFVVEVHYLVDLLLGLQFDFFYHEHCNYYSLHSLRYLLERFGLAVIDAERLDIHGGSLRVVAQFASARRTGNRRVEELLISELELGIGDPDTYFRFASDVDGIKDCLRGVLKDRKFSGGRIFGYGASGRSVTLLNYMDIGLDLIDFMVDESPVRANHILPGVHIPIWPRDTTTLSGMNTCLITAWPYADHIMGKEHSFLEQGGEFIVPLPSVKVFRDR